MVSYLRFSSSSLQRLTEETNVPDPGQMAYQARNPWLWPKLIGSRRSLRALQTLPGIKQTFDNYFHIIFFKIMCIVFKSNVIDSYDFICIKMLYPTSL